MARQSYLFFLNSQDFGYNKGFVGLGLRELGNDELTQYCFNSSKPNIPPYYLQQKSPNKYLLTSDFLFSCVYKWLLLY
jgi:hypothetical protein